jgi:hypothetical protein
MTKEIHPLSLARKKWARHKAQSKFRNIGFHFSFDEWYDWWLSHGVDRNLNIKWTGKYRPCMCRKNDLGDYEPNNVYFANHIDNVKDAHVTYRAGIKKVKSRELKKIYRWGDQLVDSYWLRDVKGISFWDSYHYFRDSIIDKAKRTEYKKLRVKYISTYGHLSNKTEYQGLSAWYPTQKQAAASMNMSYDKYRYRVANGIIQFRINGPKLRDFVIANSRYLDPYIPVDAPEY